MFNKRIVAAYGLAVLISAVVFSCATVVPLAKSVPPGDLEGAATNLDAIVDASMQELGVDGMSLVVVDKNGVLYNKGFGWADKAKSIPFDSQTLSNIGSVSKLFTAMGVAKLVQEGKVDLDAPISRYIPEFSIRAGGYDPEAITVRQVLTHHAGLQNDFYDEFSSPTPYQDYPTSYRSVVAKLAQTTITSAPGELMSYSNVGFSLLGCLIERVSGQDFATYMEKELLQPFGMTSSSFMHREDLISRHSLGYTKGKASTIPYIRDMPAGSLMASANDMSAFMVNILRTVGQSKENSGEGAQRGPLLAETLRAMWEQQNTNAPLDFGFKIGLTWWYETFDQLPAQVFVGHGGDLPPFHAYLLIEPDRGLAAFAMVNSMDTGSGSSALIPLLGDAVSLYDQALPDQRFPRRTESSVAAEGQAIPAPRKQAELPAEWLATLPGVYTSSVGIIPIKREGNRLTASFDGFALETDYYGDGYLYPVARFLGIDLKLPVLQGLRLKPDTYRGKPIVAIEIEGTVVSLMSPAEQTELTPLWKSRLGTYIPDKFNDTFPIKSIQLSYDQQSKMLLVGYTTDGGSTNFPVSIMDDNTIRTQGYGRSCGIALSMFETETSVGINFMGLIGTKSK